VPTRKATTHRSPWSKEDVKELKAHSKARTPVAKIAKAMKRTEGGRTQAQSGNSRYWPRPRPVGQRRFRIHGRDQRYLTSVSTDEVPRTNILIARLHMLALQGLQAWLSTTANGVSLSVGTPYCQHWL
jgi:hypothetical protein